MKRVGDGRVTWGGGREEVDGKRRLGGRRNYVEKVRRLGLKKGKRRGRAKKKQGGTEGG